MRMHAGESRHLKKSQINTTAPFCGFAGQVEAVLHGLLGVLQVKFSTLWSVAAGNADTLRRGFRSEKSKLLRVCANGLWNSFRRSFDDLRKEVLAPKTQIAGRPRPSVPSTPSLDSRIISDFPAIFAEFRKFSLLSRGSRDGFQKEEFHRRCDDHTNTLTVILDTKGNIFGGFTPVEWDSSYDLKADDSQKSFVFTLKNPHNIPARRFALKAEKKHHAIMCNSERKSDNNKYDEKSS
jgi:hypothetical protein